MDKKDLYIKAKLQEDKKISNQANEIFEKFEGGINLENNNKQPERKVIKIKLNQAILAFTSLIIVFILGGNLYAHLNGKPNLYSAIKGLFVKEDKYTASEIIVDQTVESNGIKLTLKTVAMDENVLITKYVAEGEKIANEFYTYPEFEEEVIEYWKMIFYLNGWDIGEDLGDITGKDTTRKAKDIQSKLEGVGVTTDEAIQLMDIAFEAYKEYVGAEYGGEAYSSEKGKELISETIAMFESKVASKYQIIQSSDTLQNFNINAISQKIERNGNQYIIYNVYNVDTISDLASKFNLNINVTQIGSTKGTWNFSTELEKARLDTRVETIDFYENNSKEVTAYVTTSDKVRHTVKVEVKRLIISDFSSVIMIQTDTSNAPDAKTEGAYSQGAPYIFVVTDEFGNVVGTGTRSKEDFESADSKYTDRIILESVNMNTKKLFVKIYEQWDMSEYGDEELTKINDHTIELDIEAARNYNKPVELTQSYVSKDVQVSFKYPVDWKVEEADGKITITSPENVDGKIVKMIINKKEDEKTAKEIANEKISDLEKASFEYTSGTKTIAGIEGYYYTVDFGDEIATRVLVNRENDLYDIEYAGIETEYARYEETFNKILETIEFVEPEKSYKTFGNGSIAILKLYEDGVLTITFPTGISEKIRGNETANFPIEDNVEYTVTGNVPNNITNITVMYVADYELETPDIFIETEEKELYYINVINAMNTGEFVVEEKLLDNVVVSSIHRATDEIYENLNIYKDIVFAMVETTDGKIYTIWTNITTGKMTLEEYIQPENNKLDSKYENMSYELFEINNGVIKQYEDNTVTVEWNDAINNHENKLWEVKPNIEYVITGLDGKVKSVHGIIKDRQEKNMHAIKILTDKGTLYGRFDLKTDYTLEASNVGVIYKVETVVLQQSAYNLVVITENDNVYNVNYDMYTTGKAPSKQTIYNCLLNYCNASEKLALNEPIENAFELIAYLDNGDGNYKADVRVKIFDSSISETKSMRAVIVFDAQNNIFKVETFEENPRGGGGY